MDSISQIVLGAALAGAIAPGHHRRAALLAGAALGTLPDLDSLPIMLFTDNPVSLMTMHRSLSHSLFVLPLVAYAIWWWFRSRGKRVTEAPTRWFWAILLALVTHPVLDAFTVYGTQLLWPLPTPPVMWSSVFIIDPLYTIWLLLACVIAWVAVARPVAHRALLAGLLVSTSYLGWSLMAKALVDSRAERDLAALGLQDAPRFSVPMPFNTLLWRVVAMTPDGYVIGDRSLAADRGPMSFKGYKSNVQALAEARNVEAVRQLAWFNRGFMRARIVDGKLVLSDLRMGLEPDYSFNFVVAERTGNGTWRPIAPAQHQSAYRVPVAQGQLRDALGELWQRIWQQPSAGRMPVAAGIPP